MMILDVPYIFRAAGGPIGVLNLLREAHPETKLSYATVQMWSHRAAIPSAWIAPLLAILTQKGHTLEQLLVEDDPFAQPRDETAAWLVA